MDLQIDRCEEEGIVILRLRGRLAIGQSEATLREAILAMLKSKPVNVILDFAEVKEIDDDGLGAIIFCYAGVRRADGDLKLLHLSRIHMDLFILLRLHLVFEVFTDKHDAVNSFFPDRIVPHFDVLEFVTEQDKHLLSKYSQMTPQSQSSVPR